MDIHSIKYEIDNAPHGRKGAIVKLHCKLLGISKYELYRKIKMVYGASKKIEGKPKIENRLIDMVARLKVQGMNFGENERELSTEECIEIMKNSNVPGAKDLKVPTVNRRLRERGLRTRDKIVRVEAKRPNQTHQLDFSRSKYFQIYKYDTKKADYILKVSGKKLTYKENENNLRTWLVGIIDTYSRIPLAMAFAATGESAAIGMEFLNFAYNRPEDDHPLRYIPETLKTDNGAFIKNKSVQNMLKALDIKSELVIPYKHRGIQKIESLWKLIWQRYELPLAVQLEAGAEIYLSEYNELLHEKMIEFAEMQHPMRSGTKLHVYKAGLVRYQPREIKVDVNEAAFRVIERKVDQTCQVQVNNVKYEVPLFAIDKRIRIYSNGSGEMIGELIDEYHKPFKLDKTDGYVYEGDFTHRAPATYREQLEKQIEMNEARDKTEKEDNKIKYMQPSAIEQKPDTVFSKPIVDFSNWYEAKVYLGSLLRAENMLIEHHLEFIDSVFEELGDHVLNKQSLIEIVDYLKNQKAVNH